MTNARTVYLIVCGASPATDAIAFVRRAVDTGWDCHVIGTPASRDFIDLYALESARGHSVTFHHRCPGEPKRSRPPADAVVIAPATANTVNKLAAGVGGNYALDVVSELIGAGVPTVVVPFVNTLLANRKPFKKALVSLADENVAILSKPGGSTPHRPGAGPEYRARFPWNESLTVASSMSQ